jgi:NACHT domain
VANRDQRRSPLPVTLSAGERDFYLELRRLIDAAGLTCRALEAGTSAARSSSGESCHYSKSGWARWLNGQGQPPRKAISKLAEKLSGEQISASHLPGLWDNAFAPAAGLQPPPEAMQALPDQPRRNGDILPRTGRAAEPAVSQVGAAAEKLVSLVTRECAAELNDRVLQGWKPLVVGWRPYTGPNADLAAMRQVPPGHAADVGPLADYVRCGHRLVVLGPGGAGKTTLCALVMDELLANRQPEDRVPVLVPAASLATGEMVKSWLERTLAGRYPSLRDTRAYGARVTGDLVRQNRLLPVIDGLDDLKPGPRAHLLAAISRAFGRCEPLIVTCRHEEYDEAVQASGQVLPGAAVIELQPAAAEDVAGFLERGAAGRRAKNLRRVAAAIRSDPEGPVAEALSSPLMAGLVRSAHADRAEMPASLTGHSDQAAIENQVLGDLIQARFSSRASSETARPQQPWSAPDAERWLGFLATHLTRLRTYDLDWPRLRYALPAFTSPLRRAALAAALAAVAAGTVFGLSRGLSFGPSQGLLFGLGHGLDAALVVGAVYLLAPLSYPPEAASPAWLMRLQQLTRTPLRTAITIPAAYAMESGLRDGIGVGLAHGIATGIFHGLIAAALNWLVASILVGLAIRAGVLDLAEMPVYFSLRLPGRGADLARILATGLVWGAGLGLVVGYGVKILSNVLALEHPLWGLGVPAGAVIGTAFALVQWGRTPVASAPAASPVSILRADRSLVLVLAVPFLVILPALFGAGFALGSRSRLHDFIHFGLYGLGIGLTIWLAIALSHTWPQYLIATGWLAACGRLPWRLAAFLIEAHDLQILRQRGGAYQFRHASLQDHLARARAPVPSLRTPQSSTPSVYGS